MSFFSLRNLFEFQVCKELQNGATRVWDPEQRVPYIVKGDMWVGYDDPESIKEKVSRLKCFDKW